MAFNKILYILWCQKSYIAYCCLLILVLLLQRYADASIVLDNVQCVKPRFASSSIDKKNLDSSCHSLQILTFSNITCFHNAVKNGRNKWKIKKFN